MCAISVCIVFHICRHVSITFGTHRSLGMHDYIHGGSIVGAFFVIFVMNETKGKSLDTLKSSETKC